MSKCKLMLEPHNGSLWLTLGHGVVSQIRIGPVVFGPGVVILNDMAVLLK